MQSTPHDAEGGLVDLASLQTPAKPYPVELGEFWCDSINYNTQQIKRCTRYGFLLRSVLCLCNPQLALKRVNHRTQA